MQGDTTVDCSRAILNRVRVRVCVCRLNRVKDRVAPKLLPLLGGAYRRKHTI